MLESKRLISHPDIFTKDTTRKSRRLKKEDEMALDTDINQLHEPLPSVSVTSSSSDSLKGDSIIGHSEDEEEEEEEEEDEVNDLLAEEDS